MHRSDVDLLAPSFHVNPWDAYRWMRENEPVFWDEANQLWGVSLHADILDVEHRPEVFSSAKGYRSMEVLGEDSIIAIDDPRHRQQRALVSKRFTPTAARSQRQWIDEMVVALCVGPIERERIEVVGELAGPLPAMWISETLGFGADRWPEVKSWSERMAHHDGLEPGDPRDLAAGAAVQEYSTALSELAADFSRCPADALIPTWLTAEIDGQPMSYNTVEWETLLFIVGGAETTRTALVHGLHAFTEHPDQWELMAERPELVESAVEEVIRWVTPLNNMFRTALRDTTIGATKIAAGDRVMLLYPSANRDGAAFDQPYSFDIERTPNRHLGFGHGIHFCLGANTARNELASALTHLSRHITNLAPSGPLRIEPNVFARTVTEYEITFDRR